MGNQAVSEEYNGASWTTGNAMNTARESLGGLGTQTAGLSFGGYTTGTVDEVEEYNGTSWTDVSGNLGTARYGSNGSGTQTAGLSVGGYVSAPLSSCEEYDGSTWSAGGALGTAKQMTSVLGTLTDTVSCGGATDSGATVVSAVDSYNGTAWSTSHASLSTARSQAGGAGTTSLGIVFGGYTDGSYTRSTSTEELAQSVTARTVTDS